MVDAGVPDFNIGINSGGNTFHSINGYRVDHNQFGGSNANAVVNKAINNMQNNYFSQQHYQASYSQNLSNSIASYEQSSVAQASVGAFGNTISGVGFAGSVASNVDGTFRLLKSGSISLGYYTSGWIKGNQYVKNLYSVSKVGTRVSTGVSIITTGIAYNEIIKGDRSPFNYADATVGTIGLSSSAVSYFRGSRIPGVGFFIAIYGAGRLGWDVGASLAYKYGPINGTYWHGNKNREYYGY